MAFKSLVRFGAGIAWQVVSRIIFFTFIGVLINWVLFFMLPDMCNLSSEDLAWGTYLQELASQCTVGFIVGLLFLIGFPAAYIFLGYKYSFQNAIHYAYVKNKSTFYDYISDKMLSFVADKQSGSTSALQLAGNFLEKLDNVPWVMRVVINFLKDKIPFVEVLEKMNVDMDITPENSTEVANRLAQDADEYIEDELLKPDMTLVWLLMGINAAIFAFVKWMA